MKKLFYLLFLLSLVVLPLVSADLIPVGERYIDVNGYITNIKDFSDYIFIQESPLPACLPRLIGDDGLIKSYWYKLCDTSVYAVKKEDVNESYIEELGAKGIKYDKGQMEYEEREEYMAEIDKFFLNLTNPIPVVGEIHSKELVPLKDTKNSITYYYTLTEEDFREKPAYIKEDYYSIVEFRKPDKTIIGRNYVFWILPFMLTFLVELLIVWSFVKKIIKKNFRLVALYVFLINLITWPIAEFLLSQNSNIFILIEAGVILVESILIMFLFKIEYRRALLISFLANLATMLLSAVLNLLAPLLSIIFS